jgi:hypothetical protein
VCIADRDSEDAKNEAWDRMGAGNQLISRSFKSMGMFTMKKIVENPNNNLGL